ncbi:hypothetical protein BC936DRAFT_142187 [Jimgerdemannia flammicorona]|uniref:Uncharacterized protein n=1 Tax=Jimgerdemannia flammicorona TaxID=994334 RepID=A0A433A0T0_9FUNG|nr:hypothetical protein BC936DRAFT_142187 [Jimgerdemannia flammicorona]
MITEPASRPVLSAMMQTQMSIQPVTNVIMDDLFEYDDVGSSYLPDIDKEDLKIPSPSWSSVATRGSGYWKALWMDLLVPAYHLDVVSGLRGACCSSLEGSR